MLESLPPLKFLCLLCRYTPALLTRGAVLRKHGPTLLELELHRASPSRQEIDLYELALGKVIDPIFSDNDVLELSRQLPLLKKLQICVQRRRGLEGAVYTALGQFKCLEELELVLNCLPEMNIFDHPVPSRELTDFEMVRIWHSSVRGCGWPRWYLRDLLINCAIDEALAKAIFSYVWKGRNGNWLQRLTIYPLYSQLGEYSSYFYHGYCRNVKEEGFLDQLAPTWVVEPDLLTGLRAQKCVKPRSDLSDPVEEEDETLTLVQEEGGIFAMEEEEDVQTVFQSLWPTADINAWPLHWHSWPLGSSEMDS
ncbi:uncharacterized protein BO88DRAFT_353487 [Aspergillus vadensis CBS 113365]|uniref:Uncharacterized protein n=1 Tax=Aspergillus vadensis (strain CBS 113365 / IMI 142717 / IBT 24658) TaxID=1448311 RepID=A0A319AVJ0_ASPVC|nr:hypothetical protein BO88DRAFT_353487 [Aspergillus vadensis CBS 113365]PYH63381.1 hypothetical protein BO88DRAFT_353487 [Aspergillus vadensis CBS 113365]